MRLATWIATAALLELAMALPAPAAVTLTDDTSGIPINTGSPAAPINNPGDIVPPIATPAIHKIVTETKHLIPEPTVTAQPVTCEIIPCTTTAFWYYSPYLNRCLHSGLSSLYCEESSKISTTCLDQNHLPKCLYHRTVFPFASETTIKGFWQNTILPVYTTTSKCVPPDPQRNAFPLGQLSCHSYCKYHSPLTGDCTLVTTGKTPSRSCEITGTSTKSTCVESLSDCLWWEHTPGVGDPVTATLSKSIPTTMWERPFTSVCVPPKTPTSGGCSWFTYHEPPDQRSKTDWPETSTCIYPDAKPSCVYTYSGKCVSMEEAATKGKPPQETSGPTTTTVVTVGDPKTKTAIPAPVGHGELDCTWRIPNPKVNRRECWNKNVEVDDWDPRKSTPKTCTWHTTFTTKINKGKTTIALASSCEPTATISWRTTTYLSQQTLTFGSTSSKITTKTMTRPVTSKKPSATASVDRGDPELHIDLDGSVLDKGLKEATNLCAHREPLDGRRLNCELMPEWAMDEYVQQIEETLMNQINDNGVKFSPYMEEWIYGNDTLRKIYIARGAGRQMVYNMTHALALEEHFSLDPEVMIEVNQEMREDFPDEVKEDEDDETQQEAPRYKPICQLKKGDDMPKKDADAMIKYLEGYLDKNFPKPKPKPVCIPKKQHPVTTFDCECKMGAKTGHFPTKPKTIQTTVSGTKTQKVDLCDYTAWSKQKPKETKATPAPTPAPVPSDEKVRPNIMTCNAPSSAGLYGVQTVADYARKFWTEAYSSHLAAKPTGTAVNFEGGWDGFKVLRTNVEAKGSGGHDDPPRRSWMALSIQWLRGACEDGHEDDDLNFAAPYQITPEDFLEAFVMRSNGCNPDPDNEVGVETWTPGGTFNYRCLQWKLHSLDVPPPDSKKHWVNGTLPWNTTLEHALNETVLDKLWSNSTFAARWPTNALVTGLKG